MVPVVPGTQHVSVGGAIASDIHGKNHGAVGTFGTHVEALGLLIATGEVLELGPQDPLFLATLGGMGLTGAILWARIRPACGRAVRGCRSTPTASMGSRPRSPRCRPPAAPTAWRGSICWPPGPAVASSPAPSTCPAPMFTPGVTAKPRWRGA